MKNKKGSALITIVMVFGVLVILSLASLRIMSSESDLSLNSYDKVRSYYLARAGADITAAYLIENPDNLSATELENFIDAVVASGESSNTKLDNSSSDYFNVTLSRDGNDVVIESVATVQSGVQAKVTLVIEQGATGFGLDAALYIDDDSTAKNNTVINGDVVYSDANAELELKNSAVVNGSFSTDVRDFPMPAFPSYPTSFAYSGNKSPSVLQPDTYYTSGLEFDGNNVVVNVGSDDFVIRVNGLIMKKTTFTINRSGNGIFIMFIDDGNDVLIDDESKYNANGNSEDSIIYADLSGDEKEFYIKKSTVNSDMYVLAKKLVIQDTSVYNGQIVFEGTESGQGIEIKNTASSEEVLLYAPDSYVLLDDEFQMNGVVVTGELLMQGNCSIDFVDVGDSNLLGSILGTDEYVKKFYK